MASVTFEHVSKRFGDVTAVDDLDLEIHDQEFMILLGPSGCGKTTALRMIAGLEDVSDGVLRIGGDVVNDVEPGRRDISMVFQSYALYPHLSVSRNIESPLLVRKYHPDGPDTPARKLTRSERQERVVEAARILGLDELLSRKPRALSGGQRQRVALARALVGRPKAFLMDEPLSNLDAKLRANTRIELVDMHRRVERTIVYVTHDQIEAVTMATRIAILSEGRLQQVGTPREVYAAPANLFVAGFLGTPPMNTIRGTVTTGGDSPAVVAGSSRFPLPTTMKTRLEEGRPVVLGVRPEHLELSGAASSVTMEVRASEWLGAECLVLGTVAGSPVVCRQPGVVETAPGATLGFAVDPDQVHLFDPDSNERIP